MDPLIKHKVLFDFASLTLDEKCDVMEWLKDNVDDYHIIQSKELFYNIIYFGDSAKAIEFKLVWGDK